MKLNLGTYRKTIVTTVGGVLGWAQIAYVPDGSIDRPEWYGLAVTLATALGVYGVANRQVMPSVWVDAPVADTYPAADPADPVAPVDPPALAI